VTAPAADPAARIVNKTISARLWTRPQLMPRGAASGQTQATKAAKGDQHYSLDVATPGEVSAGRLGCTLRAGRGTAQYARTSHRDLLVCGVTAPGMAQKGRLTFSLASTTA